MEKHDHPRSRCHHPQDDSADGGGEGCSNQDEDNTKSGDADVDTVNDETHGVGVRLNVSVMIDR